jgi:chemotaxis protein MotA
MVESEHSTPRTNWWALTSPTTAGLLAGFALLAWMIALLARDVALYLNLPGLLLVLGGTLAATVASYPLREVLRVFKVLVVALRNENVYAREDVDELVHMARLLYRGNLRGVEDALERTPNPFLRTGVQLVLDNTSLDDLLNLLQWRIMRLRARERAEAQIFRSMAAFAPAFGMLGTLLGLINMLDAMTEAAIGEIGRNLAIALVTTLYGVASANLLFKPIAVKLERRTEQRVMNMNMVVEGVIMLHESRSPAFIRETLQSFLAHYDDEIREAPREQQAATQPL